MTNVLAAVLVGAIWASISFEDHNGMFLVLAALFLAEFLYLGIGIGVSLTADFVIVHNLRRRKIAWSDIQTIRIERIMGNRIIALYQANGRRTRLRAPVTRPLNRDRRFEEKFHTIGQWWLAHRGDAWAPRSETSGWTPITGWEDRPRIRPAFSQSAPIFLVLGCLSCDATIGGFFAPPTGDATAASRVLGSLVLAAIALGLWYFSFGAGVTLSAESVKVHNLRRRTVRWSDVASMAVERTWRGTRIVLHDTAGRRTRLSGPRIGFLLWDSDFEDKARAIHQRWRDAVDADNAESPVDAANAPAEPSSFLTPGAAREPHVWKRVVVGLACLGLVYELLLSVVVTLLFAASGPTS